MSESAHIRNLLQKSVSSSPQLETASLPGSLRFGVKGASIQVIDSLCELIEDAFSDASEEKVLVKYTFYADAAESIFYSNVETITDDLPQFEGDFFEAFPDLFVSIFVSNDHIYGYPPPSADAVYVHDSDDTNDTGEIVLHVYLPKDASGTMSYMRSNMIEIAGVLSHEMQHVVQKLCYGEKLSSTSGESLLSHAFDKNEIDARVEEVITNMGVNIPENDEKLFLKTLDACLDEYLKRNAKDTDDLPLNMKDKMLSEHLMVYRNKMRDNL